MSKYLIWFGIASLIVAIVPPYNGLTVVNVIAGIIAICGPVVARIIDHSEYLSDKDRFQ